MTLKPMKRLRIAIQASRDLRRIRQYIAKTSPRAADDFVSQIIDKMDWIAEVDFTGVPRDDISPGLRALPFRDRCIYFRRYDDIILIVRILHGAQDTETQSFQE